MKKLKLFGNLLRVRVLVGTDTKRKNARSRRIQNDILSIFYTVQRDFARIVRNYLFDVMIMMLLFHELNEFRYLFSQLIHHRLHGTILNSKLGSFYS